VYYLQVNYVQGNPEYSWDVDPEKLQTAAAMLDWLRKSGVRWIVKTGEYPALLRRPLEELQTQGVFEPVASTQAEDFDGFRFEDKKMRIKVLILELRPAKP
jgi:phosphoglycolate phosphatase-like HAD superfamily hydrolase